MTKADERDDPGQRTGGEKRPSHADELEDYAGGYIQSRHGSIQPWLLAVYAVLFVWALYYLYVYWGGLGPGLAN
jgi:hypothetical protein